MTTSQLLSFIAPTRCEVGFIDDTFDPFVAVEEIL